MNNNQQTWRLVNAGGMVSSSRRQGTFWLVDTDNRLFCYHDERLEKVSVPTEDAIEHMPATAQRRLWLLTAGGSIFVRAGCDENPIGSGWVRFPTLQFEPDNAMRYVSLGFHQAWACDSRGLVYFRSGDNAPPTLLSPAWPSTKATCYSKRWAFNLLFILPLSGATCAR